MTHIDDLPETLKRAIGGRDLIVFDGECVLCSGFFRTMVRLDTSGRFHFATAQSPFGTSFYEAMGLPTDDYETNLVVVDGVIHQRLDAFAAAMSAVGWPWKALASAAYIPEPFKSFLYHRIARNRYAIFGRFDTCMMPDPALSARFIDTTEKAA